MAVDSKDTASFDSIFNTGETDIRAKVELKPVPSALPAAVSLPPAPPAVPTAVLPLPPAPTPRPPKLPPGPETPVIPPAMTAAVPPVEPVLPPVAPARVVRPLVDLDPVLPPTLPVVVRAAADLDPKLPPAKKTPPANLDPSLPAPRAPAPTATTTKEPAADALSRLRGLPLSPLLTVAAFVVGVAIVFVVLDPGSGASRAQVTSSEAARAKLLPLARSDVEEAAVGVARTLHPDLRLLVVRDPQAFIRVLPDGWLVITDGLLDRLESKAQLAALVAHAVAHHRAGHLNDDVGQVFTPAEEEEADREAIAALERAGFRARALGDVQDRLKQTAWARQHAHSGQALLGADVGDEGKADYAKSVLAVLHPPKAAPRPLVPVRIEN